MTPMKQLADRYADELSAQYRTLNLFAKHAGEIGRAHEVFLREILRRFLPGKLQCGTGFIAAPDRVTRQQDIIVFNAESHPMLFKVGDCLVVDAYAVAGTVEVKTSLDSVLRIAQAVDGCLDARYGFAGLYAWEGVALEHVLEYVWDKYRGAANLAGPIIPDALYVRGQYLLVPNDDGRRDTPPLRLLRLDSDEHSEGEALLCFVERMWICGVQRHAACPWWISEWRKRLDKIYESVPWADDLKERAEKEQREAAGEALVAPKIETDE